MVWIKTDHNAWASALSFGRDCFRYYSNKVGVKNRGFPDNIMTIDDSCGRRKGRRETLLNGILIILILAAVASVGFVFTSPQDEGFTEFFLLMENASGESVAADYPKQFVAGSPGQLIVGITNRENEPASYAVVVQLHHVVPNGDSETIVKRESLGEFETRLQEGETWQRQHRVRPTIIGDRLRLTYLLYRGAPPENPTVDSAYRETHIWISVRPE